MFRQALLAALGLLALVLARPVRATDLPRQVRLDYERQDGAGACPDETAIRTGVAARLGYDPFRADTGDHLHATVRQAGSQLEARIELRDAQGNLRAERRLVSRRRDCAELASSVELAIAIAIDPIGGPQPASPANPPTVVTAPSTTPSPADQPVPIATASAASAPAATVPLATELAAAVLLGVGSAPAASLGVLVGGSVEGGMWSVGVEGRADLPAAKELRAGEARAYLLTGSLVPCLHLGRAAACGLATGGVRRVSGHGLIDERSASLTYLGLGARLALALPVGDRLLLTLHGDVTAPLTQTRLKVDDEVVWTSPAVAVALAVGLAVRFP